MTAVGVILYGPPGVGKDTITAELNRSGSYSLFERLKAGAGRTTGYRMTSVEHIEDLDQAGEVLYRNSRYQAEYAIDRGGLTALVEGGRTPVLHMGQVEGATAVEVFPLHWVQVLLWCPLNVTAARCAERGDNDVEARLQVWHETQQDLLSHADNSWSLVLRTDQLSPSEAAHTIDQAVTGAVEATARDIRRLVA
ncbi:AAA family ATPase [Streptomyces albireticuli]|uniref:Guanylate kinase n=1 Tax=Streptomyces albireticuli TaxID=1940 RepID=A0A2A2D387_9ACTN|nr:AAA family ATPase [Streptomyces albireticuli]MCD9142390.1 AAA family ATPase [Streptomyces albireticuli]MCD9166035.1 AAA family ATPase [Streptomyces albireticuli]MCD9192518.1 AAA family ATPase [Streptomyces albireticuli]PAU45994.1 guanylate kinase [Streptomyces albireticuli]